MSIITTSKDYGLLPETGSRIQFRKILDQRNHALMHHKTQQRSVLFLHEDFAQDTINLDDWTLTKDANATNYVITAGGVANGTITGIAANTNGEGIGIFGYNIFKGALNCGMEVRLQLSVVAGVSYEVGFADTATDFKDPIVSDIDVPTVGNGAGDLAVITMDTSQTLTTSALVTKGSGGQAAATTTLNLRGAATTFAPTAATDFVVRIQCIVNTAGTGTDVYATISDANDVLKAEVYKQNGFAAATLMRPYVNVNRVSASTNSQIDYITRWQDRY